MHFEAITHNDLIEVGKLQPEGWSDILPSILFYINSPFCHPIKALIEEEIAGIGAAIVFHKTSWIAHIIVTPKHRNKGIGSLIVNELLHILADNSVETISLIATELGKPVYVKAGFRPITEYTFLEKTKKWEDSPVSTNVVPYQVKYRDAILELDQYISGEERSALLTPVLNSSFLFVGKGKVVGYYLPDLKEWNYAYTGIFDSTHLRFFGIKNIEKMLADANLEIGKINRKISASKSKKFLNRMLQGALIDYMTEQYIILARKNNSSIALKMNPALTLS